MVCIKNDARYAYASLSWFSGSETEERLEHTSDDGGCIAVCCYSTFTAFRHRCCCFLHVESTKPFGVLPMRCHKYCIMVATFLPVRFSLFKLVSYDVSCISEFLITVCVVLDRRRGRAWRGACLGMLNAAGEYRKVRMVSCKGSATYIR